MKIELDNIYNCDCLEGMRDIPDHSVDCIICDLPYGTTQNKWDAVIPFAPLWEQYKRIAKDNAAIVLFGQSVFSAELICSNKEMYRYSLVWEKSKAGGFLNANRMPLQSHEDIMVFYKKMPVYNPQMEIGKPYTKKSVSNGDGGNYGKFERVGTTAINSGTRYPKSIIRFANDNHNSMHPTQKPVDLVSYLVRTYTNAGGVVLDNCMGSGTTAIACIKEKRHFIGFELNEEYYKKACDRIRREQAQPTLF